MVNYQCNRCGYETKHKANFITHLNRKNICVPLLEDISIEEVKKYYNFNIPIISSQKSTILHQNPPKLHQNPPNPPPKISTKKHQNPPKFEISSTKKHQNPPKSPVINECPYCYKRFSRSDSLNRHYGRCKIKKNLLETELLEKKDNEIQELKEMVEKLLIEKGNTNITNNTNNSHNTTNNIININNYGDENTKYITSDYILKLLKNKPAKAIPELIKYTHFNKEHPENQNIKITNKKEPYIKVLKNDKWELQDKDETITDLIDRQQVHLLDETVEEKIEEKCNNSEKINIERCNNLYNEDDKEYMKRLYNESELIILNNS